MKTVCPYCTKNFDTDPSLDARLKEVQICKTHHKAFKKAFKRGVIQSPCSFSDLKSDNYVTIVARPTVATPSQPHEEAVRGLRRLTHHSL
jgi:glutaredoxin